MEKAIYIASANKSKIKDFEILVHAIDPSIEVLLVPDYVAPEESGKTIEENSRLKVLACISSKLDCPVLANDFELKFDPIVTEIRDTTQVKRIALNGAKEEDLSQNEIAMLMIKFYKELAKKYGGKINCEARDCFSILLKDGTIRQIVCSRKYELVDKEVSKVNPYSPLNSLRRSKITGKFMDEMTEEEFMQDRKPQVDALRELLLNVW